MPQQGATIVGDAPRETTARPEGPTAYRPTIALIMIVKNEADNLPELLGPIHEKFDEIIVVDTGSEDGTPEIARRYGAKVYFFEWIDDFAAARNESIRHATSDWLFWLDGDDRIHPDEVDRIRKIVAMHPERDVAFYCHLRSLGSSWSSEQNLVQVRLLPNLPGVEFRGAIHERCTDSLRELGVQLEFSPIEVVHTGYMKPEDMPEKYRRNEAIIRQVLEKDPEDLHTRFQLVMQLLGMGEREAAIEEVNRLGEYVEKAAGTSEVTEQTYRYYVLRGIVFRNSGDLDEAERCFKGLVEAMPDFGMGHYLLSTIYYVREDWAAMHQHLVKADHYGIAVEAVPIPLARVYFDIAAMKGSYYARQKQWVLAAKEYRAAIRLQPEFLVHYVDLGGCYLLAQDAERALQVYELGIRVHDQAVERLQEAAPERLEEGTEEVGTVAEMSPEARIRVLSRLYEGAVRALVTLERTSEARAMLETGLARAPNALNLLFLQLEMMLEAGRIDGARRSADRILEAMPDEVVVFEAVVNAFIRHGQANVAVPYLWRLWERFPAHWDAALVAMLTALQFGDVGRANTFLAAVRDHLVESGISEAAEWPAQWRVGHPILNYFSDVNDRTAEAPVRDPNATAAERQQQGRAFAEKLASICHAIRTVLQQRALHAWNGASPGQNGIGMR